MTIYDEKAATGSKGVQGAVIALAAGIAATLQGFGVVEAEQIPDAVIGVVTSVGALLALVGRLTATARITGIFFK